MPVLESEKRALQILEKSIEGPVVKYAKQRGLLIRKLNGLGFRAWPDRLFLGRGRILFVEFKRPGGKLTPLQESFHVTLRKAGFRVETIDDVDEGRRLLDEAFR